MAYNFSALCRLCMGLKAPLVSIYDKEKLLVEKIAAISTSVRVEPGDGLPGQVCLECVTKLDISYNFKLQCERSDASFRQILKSRHQQYLILLLKPLTPAVKQNEATVQSVKNGSEEETIPPCDDGDDKGSLSCDNEDDDDDEPALEPSLLLEVDIKEEPLDITEENENDKVSRWDEDSQAIQAAPLQQHHCKDCNSTFSTVQQLSQHLNTFPAGSCNLKCSECNQTFSTQEELKVHLKEHDIDLPFKCIHCNKRFKLQNHLEAHILRHTTTHRYPCSLCPLRFKSTRLLSLHINGVHISPNLYVCMECGHKFTIRKAYTRHISQHICREKLFQCTYCGKLFKCQTSLNIHNRVHTGEKPYVCTMCTRGFSQKSSLKVHMRIHTGEKPFECDICSSRFSLKCTLKKHIITCHVTPPGKEQTVSN